MTKKFYPMHPEIRKALELYKSQPINDIDHEEAIEWVDEAIDQLMNLGLVRVSLTEEHPDRRFASIKSAVQDFLFGLKTAVACGAILIDTRPAENQDPDDIAPILCHKQILSLTEHGWNVFSRIFPGMKEYYDEGDDYDEDQDESESSFSLYIPANAAPPFQDENSQPDDRDRVLSALYQQPWVKLWITTLLGWPKEFGSQLAELQKQDLIEVRYPGKQIEDLGQKFMLTPRGVCEHVCKGQDYDTPNEFRSLDARRLVPKARSLLEKLGYNIQGLEPRRFNERICASDIVAQKDGKRIYAMVESEDLIVPIAVDKYRAFWQADDQGRIADNMYVFCQDNQVLRDVMYLITTNFDIKPPAIYLCNLEEAERTMQTKGHPWSMIQFSQEQESPQQESGTIEPKENTP